MHRHKILARISLILSILNLVLAAPIVVREIHEARGDMMVVAEDVGAQLKKLEAQAASDEPTSSRQSQDGIASPQHSPLSDGSASSGYHTPDLAAELSDSGYRWLMERPARLSLHEPYPSGTPERPPSLPLLLQGLPSPPGSSEMSSPPGPGSDSTTETYSPERFTHSHHSSSSSISSPSETPPDYAKFFDKSMMKKLGIVAGVAVVGGAVIGGIVGSQSKHRDYQDS